jgi:hypothetical protein
MASCQERTGDELAVAVTFYHQQAGVETHKEQQP